MSGMAVEGYEIHMGETKPVTGVEKTDCFAHLQSPLDGSTKPDGYQKGNVYGTYLHGIFDAPGITGAFAKALAKKKGVNLKVLPVITHKEYMTQQFDRLAGELRAHLDMERIYQVIGL